MSPDFEERRLAHLAHFQAEKHQFSDETFHKRFEQAVRYVVPFLQNLPVAPQDAVALEIGCGSGSKTCAFAPFFKEYYAIDLNEDYLKTARYRTKKLGLTDNIEILHLEAARLGELLATHKFDCVFLYAVLEHLTVEERLSILPLIWEHLPPHGALYIGETPNRLSPVDYHSSKITYFHHLPLELAELFYQQSDNQSWKKLVEMEETRELGFYRNGQHVSYHEFDRTLMPVDQLRAHIAGDAWDTPMLNMNSIRWFELDNLEDFAGHRTDTMLNHPIDIPPLFARYWIDGILSKTAIDADQRRPDPVALSFARGRGIEERDHPSLRVPCRVLSGAGNEAIYTNPSQSGTHLTFGVDKAVSSGGYRIMDGSGRIVAEGDCALILAAVEDYWNPVAYRTIDVTGTDVSRFRFNAQPGGTLGVTGVLIR